MRLLAVFAQRWLSSGRRILLASIVVAASAGDAWSQAQDMLRSDPEGILDLIIATARHGDLRDIEFIARTFKISMEPKEWTGASGAVAGYNYGPTTLPFATGRAFLSLVTRTPPTAFAGEYEVGELSIVLIDTVRCVPRQATEQRMASAIGPKRTAEVSHGPPKVFYKAIEDKDRIIYVDTLFDVKAECLASVQIRHRL